MFHLKDCNRQKMFLHIYTAHLTLAMAWIEAMQGIFPNLHKIANLQIFLTLSSYVDSAIFTILSNVIRGDITKLNILYSIFRHVLHFQISNIFKYGVENRKCRRVYSMTPLTQFSKGFLLT